MILLSIIIPIYNADTWLEQCILSLQESVAGAYSQVEYILVDDGSTDNSGMICDRYAAAHPNFHVIHQQNQGVSSARNAGLAAATGQYYAWVDPDDTVSADWFPSIADAIRTHGPDVLVMDMLRFGLGEETQEVYGRPGGWVDFDLFYTDILRDIRMRSGLPNKVMRAGLFSGVHFDTGLTILEDFDVMPQILRSAETVFYIPRCMYCYRQHEKSLLHHFSPDLAFQSVETALRRMERTERKYRSAAVAAVIRQAYSFLRTVAAFGNKGAFSSRVRFCRRIIFKNLLTLLSDPEIAVSLKCRILLSILPGYPLIMSVREKSRKEQEPTI